MGASLCAVSRRAATQASGVEGLRPLETRGCTFNRLLLFGAAQLWVKDVSERVTGQVRR